MYVVRLDTRVGPVMAWRGLGRLLWTVAACALAMLWAAPAAAAPTPAPAGPSVKYYVVSAPVDGQPEFLYEIAVRTLGNGRRYLEIFALNRDRIQPDGGRLTDPLRLDPGWILVLPADAHGPDVRVGALPVPDLVSATATGAAGSPGPGAAPATSSKRSVTHTALSVLAVLLVVLAALVLARLRSHRDAGRAPAVAGPPVRAPVRPAAPPDAPESAPARAAGSAGSTGAPKFPTEWMPGPRPEPDVPAEDRLPDPQALPGKGFPELVATVSDAGQPVQVSLVGARAGGTEPPFGWRDVDEPPLAGEVPVVLGQSHGRRLYADLSRTPDVLTVGGEPKAARRVAARLARQLVDAGMEVLAVSGVLGEPLADGVREVEAFPVEPPGPVRRVVFCGEPDIRQQRADGRLVTGAGDRALFIVVGAVARARWSVRVAAVGLAEGS
jgi:hypothetical protein